MIASILRRAGAIALIATLGLATDAGADYTYSTVLTISGGTNTGSGSTYVSANGSTVSLQDITSPGSFLTTGPLTANIGNVGVSTTSAVPDTFSVSYTDVITISNGGQTGSFTVTGTLSLSGLETTGGGTSGTVSNLYNSPFNQGPIVVGGTDFTLNIGNGTVNDFFGPPTIGQGTGATASGSLGGQITPASVPEPASMAMLGLGLVGVGAYGLRRRRSAR